MKKQFSFLLFFVLVSVLLYSQSVTLNNVGIKGPNGDSVTPGSRVMLSTNSPQPIMMKNSESSKAHRLQPRQEPMDMYASSGTVRQMHPAPALATQMWRLVP